MNAELDIHRLLAVPRLGNFLVSPDAQYIAWTWSRGDDTPDVYAASLHGGLPVRLTTTDERTVLRSWTPDSRAVIVAQDHGGDERMNLLRVDLDAPGRLEMLTDAFPPYYLHGGQMPPDSSWLVYAMNYDVASQQETETTCVYRHDLQTGERLPLAWTREATDCVPELNAAGTHILYTRQDRSPAGMQVWLVDIEGESDVEILNFGDESKVVASWFPDSRRVLFVAQVDDYRRVGVWDTTKRETTWLIDDPARNIEVAFVPPGSDNTVVVVDVREARSRVSLIDLATGDEWPVPSQGREFLPLAPVGLGSWVGRYSSAQHPADLVRRDLSSSASVTGALTSLTHMWTHVPLASDQLARAESIRWNSDDGMPIQGWLYRPPGSARGTVVHVHGGPTAHSEDEFDSKIQFLVGQGFNVLVPNYRGSTGFSVAFEESIKEDGWGGREQDDIRTGIEALIERGIAQPGKVGITGTSYGGYSSWCAITRWPRAIVAAAAPICGMTDLVLDYETTRPDLRPYSEEMMGGSPEQQPVRYHERSPVNFVQHIEGRLLIVQGARDPNVTAHNVDAARAALDAAGVAYEVLMFEDEGHGIKKPRNVSVLCDALGRFFTSAFAVTSGN